MDGKHPCGRRHGKNDPRTPLWILCLMCLPQIMSDFFFCYITNRKTYEEKMTQCYSPSHPSLTLADALSRTYRQSTKWGTQPRPRGPEAPRQHQPGLQSSSWTSSPCCWRSRSARGCGRYDPGAEKRRKESQKTQERTCHSLRWVNVSST